MQIWGAGLSGLIAASIFPHAQVIEAAPRERFVQHKALLRFRSTAVADATGIEFRKVRVHKGIWDKGFVEPNILYANMYSGKVTGRLGDRSIWNLDAVDRYIAPEDFVDQLIELHSARIRWGSPIDSVVRAANEPVVSTIPMYNMMQLTDYRVFGRPSPVFANRSITVKRWRVPVADVFQTVYFPAPSTSCYRASITGDLLIAEYMGDADEFECWRAFGLVERDLEPIEQVSQKHGKISPIDERIRKEFMLHATLHHNIFSLGRFATWRNILLDDVVKDCSVIKRLMHTHGYDIALHSQIGAKA